MPEVVNGAGQHKTRRALLVAVALTVVLVFKPGNAANELLRSTDIAVIVAALSIGLVLMVHRTSRSWGLGIALGAIAAVPLFVACVFCIIVATSPLGG